MFLALILLFCKHFVCDFPLQVFPWIYRNKGIYLHMGGITHAAIHGISTFAILSYWFGLAAWSWALIDMLIHYHVDWAKMNLGTKFNLKPDNSEWFWILLGLDQLIHHLTYFVIVYYAFNLAL